MLGYRLHLEPDDNATILVTSPDLPIATFGADEGEAIRQANGAIGILIQSMIDNRDEVPTPTFDHDIGVPIAYVSLQTELKARLHNAMRAVGMTRADLQRKLDWNRESVDRLFRIEHNSRLDQIEAAFSAMGKGIGVDVRNAA